MGGQIMRLWPVALVCALSCCLPRPSNAEPGASSLFSAVNPLAIDRRDEEAIVGFASYFVDELECFPGEWLKPEWRDGKHLENHERANGSSRKVSALAAAIYLLKHESLFQQSPRWQDWQPIVSRLKGSRCGGMQGVLTLMHDFLRGVYANDGVGTSDDYDMALVPLADLLFLFKDDPQVLPDDVVEAIICQHGKDKDLGCKDSSPEDWWDGMGGYLTFGIDNYFVSEVRARRRPSSAPTGRSSRATTCAIGRATARAARTSGAARPSGAGTARRSCQASGATDSAPQRYACQGRSTPVRATDSAQRRAPRVGSWPR